MVGSSYHVEIIYNVSKKTNVFVLEFDFEIYIQRFPIQFQKL